MSKTRYLIILLLLFMFLPGLGDAVYGQENGQESISLRINRDFGFGLGSLMQGTFSLHAAGPADLQRVDFMIDDQPIANVNSSPFRTTFNTNDYTLGSHRLWAVGYDTTGHSYSSDVTNRQFVPGSTTRLFVVVLVLIVVIGRLVSYYVTRSKSQLKNETQKFGLLGGAICPKCGNLFGIHWWSPRFGFRRLDRCPHCGKWSIVHRASREAMVEANSSKGSDEPRVDLTNEGSDMKTESEYEKSLDESRYEDR